MFKVLIFLAAMTAVACGIPLPSDDNPSIENDERFISKAIDLYYKYPDEYDDKDRIAIARVMAFKDRFGEAKTVLDGLKVSQKENPSFWALYGVVLFYSTENYEESIAALKKSGRQVLDKQVLNCLAWDYIQLEQYDEVWKLVPALEKWLPDPQIGKTLLMFSMTQSGSKEADEAFYRYVDKIGLKTISMDPDLSRFVSKKLDIDDKAEQARQLRAMTPLN